MYISKIKVDNVEIAIKQIYEKIGISLERFKELLERDFYVPTLGSAPTSETVSYLNTAGETAPFRIGQMCRVANSSSDVGYDFYVLHALADGVASWDAVDGDAIRLLDEVAEELSRVKEMMWSMSAETCSVGFARENGSADPDAEFTFGTDEMYDKITSHIRMGVVKNGIVQKTCKRGYLTVAEDGSEIAIDGSMGDVMLFTDCKFYKFCETMMIGGREMNVIAIGLSPFSYYDRKAKEIDCFALTPDGTVNCKIFDDIRLQAHCVYNTDAIGTYTAPVPIFKDVYKKSGGGYPSHGISTINSIQFAQAKNEYKYMNNPYISGYYEFFEILISLIMSKMNSTNLIDLDKIGVGCNILNSANSETFNDDKISGCSGWKIIKSDLTDEYHDIYANYFAKLDIDTTTAYPITYGITGKNRYSLVSCLEAQRLLNGISKASLVDYVGSKSNIFIMDDNGNVSVITDGSVNISTGYGMIPTKHYYIVRNIPNFKGITDGQMTALINSYTKLEFNDNVVKNSDNTDLTDSIGILKRSLPILFGWFVPLHGYYVNTDGMFYITKKTNNLLSIEFYSTSSVDKVPARTSFVFQSNDIEEETDMEKGFDNKCSITSYKTIEGWIKESNYSHSLLAHSDIGGGSKTHESSFLILYFNAQPNGTRQARLSLLGSSMSNLVSIRGINAYHTAGTTGVDYVGSFSVPHLKFKNQSTK